MCIDYYINPEKRTVVCKISDVEHGVMEDLARNGYAPATPCVYECSLLKDSFTGKAKCSDTDVFDEEKGKRIAYKRAMVKYNKSRSKLCHALLVAESKHFTNFSNVLARLFQKYDRIAASSESDCEDIINGTHNSASKKLTVNTDI